MSYRFMPEKSQKYSYVVEQYDIKFGTEIQIMLSIQHNFYFISRN